jgi:hypothetical protein
VWRQSVDDQGYIFHHGSTGEAVDTLPPVVEWAREIDQSSGEVYYIHLQGGEVQWELPRDGHCVVFLS